MERELQRITEELRESRAKPLDVVQMKVVPASGAQSEQSSEDSGPDSAEQPLVQYARKQKQEAPKTVS